MLTSIKLAFSSRFFLEQVQTKGLKKNSVPSSSIVYACLVFLFLQNRAMWKKEREIEYTSVAPLDSPVQSFLPLSKSEQILWELYCFLILTSYGWTRNVRFFHVLVNISLYLSSWGPSKEQQQGTKWVGIMSSCLFFLLSYSLSFSLFFFFFFCSTRLLSLYVCVWK